MSINWQQLRRQLALHAGSLFFLSVATYMLQAQLAQFNSLRCFGSLRPRSAAKDDDIQQAVAHQTIGAVNAANSFTGNKQAR